MRLLQYRSETGSRAGVMLDGDRVFDVGALLGEPDTPWTTRRLLENLAAHAPALRAAAAKKGDIGRLEDLELGPPLHDPDKIICLGLNYRDHAAETGLSIPSRPMLFAKFRNSLCGPRDAIVIPPATQRVDYEAELAVVIGRRSRDISPAHALEHVAGAMVLNDVSARDLQFETSQWLAGKAIDGFAPCGPTLVLTDEVGDVQQLGIRTRLNGALVQSSNTREMIFGVTEIIAFLSTLMTLEVGDIVATGTPAGVGMSHTPEIAVADGDLVEVEIDGLGALSNTFVAQTVAVAA